MVCRLLLSLTVLCLAGCSTADPSPASPALDRPSVSLATTAPPTGPPSPVAAGRPTPSPSPPPCSYGATRRLAELRNPEVREASALAASGRQPGLYWTLNDSGNEPLLFATSADGRDLGTFLVANARNEDWEGLQVGPGRDGGAALYIGDIGDNQRDRQQLTIYRVPEPDVGRDPGKAVRGRTAPAEAFRFAYPDGSHDAEALLVHPRTGEVIVLSKEFSGRSVVYRVPSPLQSGPRLLAERIAELDLRQLGPFGSAVTDAAVSPSTDRLVARTYVAALEFELSPGASLRSAWAGPPRAYLLDDGPQGEGITYRADGQALLTIGEATPAVLFEAGWECRGEVPARGRSSRAQDVAAATYTQRGQ